MSKQTVTINGTVYDKVTGLPIRSAEKAAHANRSHAISLHRRTQKSSTLHRAYVKRELKPATTEKTTTTKAPAAVAPAKAPEPKIYRRSEMIRKYAAHPVAPAKKAESSAATKPADQKMTAPIAHPVAVRAASRPTTKSRPTAHKKAVTTKPAPAKATFKPSDMIKKEAAAKALAEAPSHHRAQHRQKSFTKNRKQRASRAFSLASSGVAMLMIAGYFTYINMPNLSVRVAAIQSGVNASYPSYRPSGYSISGPVAYDNGQVRMAFAGNGTGHGFTLAQSSSGWDSTAVLDNYVQPVAGEDYTITTNGGLTIYTWGGNAAWVSGGTLYTIDGDAPLTPEQIHRLAASL